MLDEPVSVFFVDETIHEDARALIGPETCKDVRIVDRDGFGHEDTLHNLRDISQVEEIVELGWGGSLFSLDIHVDFDSACDGSLTSLLYSLLEVPSLEELLENCVEDGLQHSLRSLWKAEHVEVS